VFIWHMWHLGEMLGENFWRRVFSLYLPLSNLMLTEHFLFRYSEHPDVDTIGWGVRGWRSIGLKYFRELNREHFDFSSLCQKVEILVLIRDLSWVFVWGDVSISIGDGMSYFMVAWEIVCHQDHEGIGILCRVRVAWIYEVLHGPNLLIWSTWRELP